MTRLESSRRNKGFTLIEILIYSAITTAFLAFTIFSTYQFIDNADRSRHRKELVENQKLLEQKIYWTLQSVSTVNSPLLGATTTVLSVDKIGFSDNPIVISADGGAAWLKRGSAPSLMITSDVHISVQNLNFHQFDFNGHPAIRVSGDLFDAFTPTTINVATTIIIR